MLGGGIIMPILPLYAQDMGASGTVIGLIVSSFALSFAIFNPIVGRLADRFGFKRLIALGLGLHVPVALCYVLATEPWHLMGIRLLEGVLAVMVETVAMAYAGHIAPKDKEASVMGIFNAAHFTGFGLGPFIGGVLTEKFSITVPFYALAGLLALSLLLVLLLVPECHEKSETGAGDASPTLDLLKIALKSPIMKAMVIYILILTLGESGLMAFLPLITQDVGLNVAEIGILTSALMVSAGLFLIPFGFLANRYNKVVLIVTGVLVVGGVLFCVPLVSGFWPFMLLSIIGGMGTAIAHPAATAVVVRGSKDIGIGFAMGLYNLGMGLGMIAGPVLSGLIRDYWGLDQIFYVSATIFIFNAFMIIRYTRGIKDL